MKKICTGLLIGILLLPSVSFASAPNEQYLSLLRTLITLLQQQVQVLEEQLATLPTQTMTADPQVSGTPAVTPSVVTCSENPVITLTAPDKAQSLGTVHATYTTGCTLNTATPWKYTDYSETNSGTLGGVPSDYYVTTKLTDSQFDLSVSGVNLNHDFTMTVGSTTKTITP